MKNKTKYLIVTLCMLVGFLLAGAAIANAETTDITEIKLTGNYQYGNVPAGILPSFNPGTTTDSITIDKVNSSWEYKMQNGGWSGFGSETPVAYNDGKTDYGYSFSVETNDGYQLDYSNLKVFYNEEEVTSSVKILKYVWGAYVTVDLGKATGENPTTHTVTFNSNGGTEIAPKEVVSGLKIKAPETPTKDKYLFRGWFEDDTFSVEFNFNNTPITSDMTLYAKWEAANSINEIILAGDVQYGNVPVGTLPSFNPRTTTDSITIDESNSYWMKRESATSMWGGFAGNTPVAYNDGKTNYGYNFRVVPKDGYQLDYSTLKVIYNGKDVTSSAEVSKGYTWGAYVTIDLGKANGTPVLYTVTFNSNEGTSVESQNVNAGEKLTEPTPAPTKEGFTFDGWYEDSTFSNKFDFNTPITDSMTLYAKWTENKYTLTFDANGGSGTMAPIANLTGEYTLPANEFIAPSGKQFKGWSLTADGAIVTKVDMTENRTVYAIWEPIPVTTYTVSFNANGGSGTMADVTGVTSSYTLPANGFTAPAGQQFKGWATSASGAVITGTSITVSADTTLYAIWEPIPVTTYTVSFNANGGSGTMADVTGVTSSYTLPANGFTAPAGQQFKGWATSASGAVITGTSITVSADITLYAIWEPIPVTEYTISFNINGGIGTIPSQTTSGQKLSSLPIATHSGSYSFAGWYTTASGGTQITTAYEFSADTTVYAHWTYTGGGGGFYVPTTQKPEIKAAAGGKAELSKDGTTLTITADAGKVIDKVLLNGKDMGAVSELKGLKTGDKVEVTFKDQVTEPTKEQLDKAAKEAAGDLVLTARSAKLKNGSVKIMLKGDLKAITDAGYTVKYKFYRSTKKSAGYKAMLTKKAPTYFNTYGKKGTMYYYKARVMIYDKDGNFVAQTALKQCKYANRLWTK